MQQSATTSETTTSTKPETVRTPANALDEVARLFDLGDEDDETTTDELDTRADDNEDAESESSNEPAPDTLDALAKRLKLETADLYNIKLKLADDGREVTLGELKDAMQERDNFEVSKLEFEEERTRREHELVKTQQTIADIVSLIPKRAITDELRRAVAQRRAQVVAEQDALARSIIKGWDNEETEARERAEMSSHLEEWGFPANYATEIRDARTLRYIRESMRREQRINKALEQVRTARKGPSKPSKPSEPGSRTTSSTRANPRQRSVANQLDQVTELLNGLG